MVKRKKRKNFNASVDIATGSIGLMTGMSVTNQVGGQIPSSPTLTSVIGSSNTAFRMGGIGLVAGASGNLIKQVKKLKKMK